ncbi:MULTISPECIES: AraC family transcriptional regulator [unclassified Pseudomonas]|uniref:AraC family transcriptional regulator n=1 Tax=unclassified Pseudomonas TaxID=196821 RepID=UPI0008772457|nr:MULTISPECIES: AraC family transcriptional regulator [unclassified Pseudomonas]SCX42319.1 AraC-type DNA-binding protein [Pseudomonas sp. NFACC32-1]SFX07377.1 AraC-type DNA-binding protein [Pseudomonas sp. NFACC47-1]SFX14947.1 AraC-type DNA-binding protein [Pseudomonas sp. NFACC43]
MATQRSSLQAALADLIGARTPHTGDFQTPIAGLGLFRREAPAPPAICMIEPSIVLVAQGVKQIWIGGQAYGYDNTRLLMTSLDLPANSEVLQASPEQPCLGLLMKLDLRLVADLIAQDSMAPSRDRPSGIGASIGQATPDLLAPFVRLLALLDEPEAIPVLAPLIQREIHYRLLISDQAARLRQIASVDSQGYRIAKAIDWLKLNYTDPVRVEDLAARVQMSPPTFHHHFRQLTAMSPLQYQKWLRLNEAKRLMLDENMDVASAASKVGYESPSQFSREYGRLFGLPPKRDIAASREAGRDISVV